MSIRMSSIIILILILGTPFLGQAPTDKTTDANTCVEQSQEHIKHAETYYWLARARNNSGVEVQEAKKQYGIADDWLSQASALLNNMEDEDDIRKCQLEINELRVRIESGLQRAEKQLDIGRHFLENYSPVLRYILGNDEILVRHDLSGNLAYVKAVEKLLPTHPVLWGGTLHLIICSKSQGKLTGNDEIIHAYLNTHTDHYVIPEHELTEFWDDRSIASIFDENSDESNLNVISPLFDKICKKYGCYGIGVLQLEKLDEHRNTSFACVHFRYWDNQAELFDKTFYAQGFTQQRSRIPLLAYLLPLLGFPVTWIYIKRAKTYKGSPPPIWIATGVAFFSITLLVLANVGIGKIAPDMNTIVLSPQGLMWISLISFMYSLFPVIVSYPVSGVIPCIGRTHNRPDTIASICFGAILGSISLLLFLSWTRWGFRIDVLSVVLGSLLLIALICYRAGHSFSSWLLKRNEKGLVETMTFAMLLALLMAMPLTMKLVLVGIALPTILLITFGLPKILDKAIKPRTILQDTNKTPSMENLCGSVQEPGFIEVSELKQLMSVGEQLLSDVSQAGRATTRVLYLEGETGCGKTRFASELVSRINDLEEDNEHKCYTLSGNNEEPQSRTGNTPYPLFSQALSSMLGVNRLSDPDQNLRKLRAIASKTGLNGLSALGMGALGTLLDVAGFGDEIPRKSTEDEIAHVVSQTLTSLAQDGRVLFVLDDCQWCEVGSIRLFRSILVDLSRCQTDSVIDFIVVSQPTENNVMRTLLEDMHQRKVISLSVDDQTFTAIDKKGELTSDLLVSLGFDFKSRTALSNRFIECGCGRPLHVLQTIRLLIQKGWIKTVGNRYTLARDTNLDDLDICTEFLSMLEKQYAELETTLSDVLQCCAIVGNEFKASIISRIFRIDILELLKQLKEAERQGIVKDIVEHDDVYKFGEKRTAWYFKHKGVSRFGEEPLCQLAREYHKRYVRVLEEQFDPGRMTYQDAPYNLIKDLAIHTEMTIDTWPQKAFRYNYLAGKKSHEIGLYEEALQRYKSVEALLGQDKQSLDEAEVFLYCLAYVQCLLDAEADPACRTRCLEKLRLLSDVTCIKKEHKRAVEEYYLLDILHLYRIKDVSSANKKATRVLGQHDIHTSTQIRAKFYYAATLPRKGSDVAEKAAEAHRKIVAEVDTCLARTDLSNDDYLLIEAVKGDALNNLGFLYLHSLNWVEKAKGAFGEALVIKQRAAQNDQKGIAIAHGGLGDCHLSQRDNERAVEHYEEDYAISVRLGDLQGMCRMRSMLGKIALLKSQETKNSNEKVTFCRESRDYYEESLQIAIQQQNTLAMLFVLSGLIDVAVEKRDSDQMDYECSRLRKILDMKIDSNQLDPGMDALIQSAKKAIEVFHDSAQSLNELCDRLNKMRATK